MTAFSDLVTFCLDELFALHPVIATSVGDHRYDDQWPDTSEAGRQARLAFASRWVPTFTGVDDATLTRDERIDRDLLVGELEAARFEDTMLREDAWDPLSWVYLIGAGLHPLLAREFAPLAERLLSVTGRLEGIPTILADARATIGTAPRPVSRLHAEVAGKRVGGVAELGRQAVETAEAAAPGDLGVAAILPRLRAAADAASEALDAFGRWLTDEVAPSAAGEAALGEPLFTDKLRHTLRDPEVTPAAILARAESEFAAVRAEMVRIARDAWPAWRAGEPAPDDEGALVRGVLDAIAGRPSGRRRARLVQPRGARPGRGLLPRARDHRTRRRAARHRLDPRVHALVRRRDARLARAAGPRPEDVLLDHAGARRLAARARRVVPARDEQPPDVAARDPRGGARPLPADGVREPRVVARPPGVPVRPVRRGLGGLRDAGDARRRLRRQRPGPVAEPLEVLPALRRPTRSSTSASTRWA